MSASHVLFHQPCPQCGTDKALFEDDQTNTANPYMLSCYVCGHVKYIGDDLMKVALLFKFGIPKNFGVTGQHKTTSSQLIKGKTLTFTVEKNRVPPKTYTLKEAYEANKVSDKCVICKKPLGFHPSVGVKYCSCVEGLPQEKCA